MKWRTAVARRMENAEEFLAKKEAIVITSIVLGPRNQKVVSIMIVEFDTVTVCS
jgi:hypothetical protein